MTKFFFVSLLVGTAFCTVGCDTLKEKVGLTRHSPDEFAVMQRAPLEIPSDLNSLPAPRPGASRPQDVTAVEQAQQAILGSDKPVSDTASSGEDALLAKTGANTADASIRQQLEADAKAEGTDNRAVVKKILSLGDEQKPATVVDSAAEAKRILDAKKSGQPITSGETPTLEQ
jgi:hypothetical protein